MSVILLNYAMACDTITRQQLQSYYYQWLDGEINNYQYVIQKQCFCSPDYTKKLIVRVENNKVSDVIDAETEDKVSDKVFEQQRTISEWYELSFNYVDTEFGVLDLEVDNNGIPLSFYIDQHKMRADDEFTIHISNIETL